MLLGRSELSNNLAWVLTIPMKSIWFIFCEFAKIFSIQILPSLPLFTSPSTAHQTHIKENFAMKVNNAQMTEKCPNSIKTSTLLSLGKCNQSIYLNFLTILQQSKHLHFNRD